ncbi:Uncharacterized protein Adt_30641 [Abeliophyllum distichum]|uniref:Uncharacterized protein n=1 Tax=Abeliophyllum distichum TaxID=126358 RepID=A0ABD1RBW0_9LAMI
MPPSTSKIGSIFTTTSSGASPLNLIHEPPRFSEDIDSTCSTPYISAPSSPGHTSSLHSGYFFSALACPMHFMLSKEKVEPFSSKWIWDEGDDELEKADSTSMRGRDLGNSQY